MASSYLSNDGSGVVGVGSGSATGALRVYQSGIAEPTVYLSSTAFGGNIHLVDENNLFMCSMDADFDGEGGYLAIARSQGAGGFIVDGNAQGTKQPSVSITGTARSADFDMSANGDASVNLPSDAISSPEILDEPGVASYANGISSSGPLSSEFTTIASRTIVTPGPGYVLAIGTVNLQIGHVTGVSSHSVLGISDVSTAFPANQDIFVEIPAGCASGLYYIPATFHGLFEVSSAGSHDYYLIGTASSGGFHCYEMQLSLVYLPTSYGTVQPTLVSAAGAVTGDKRAAASAASISTADVALQRAASEAANAARVTRELEEVKARLAKLESKMANR